MYNVILWTWGIIVTVQSRNTRMCIWQGEISTLAFLTSGLSLLKQHLNGFHKSSSGAEGGWGFRAYCPDWKSSGRLNLNHGHPQIMRTAKENRKPFSLFFFPCIFFISLYSWKVNYNPEGWKQAHWQPQSPRDAAERMLGLLNLHVDPPNSLLSPCVSVFFLRGSESEPAPPSPVHVHTHLAGRSSGAPHSCQPAQPARFITGSDFFYLGDCEGQKLILTLWVTSCFTVWKLQPIHFIFMDWFKFWHCALVPTGDWGRHRSLFKSQAAVSVQHRELPQTCTGVCFGF